jgi:branched-chain amino acid transport system ATP-binding protein
MLDDLGSASAQETYAAAQAADVLMRVAAVSVDFGGVKALDNVSFTVPRGAVVGIIGPNGAGKTTLMNLISGIVKPSKGSVYLTVDGVEVELTRRPKHHRARLGIGRTFQNTRLFGGLTVIDQIMCGAYHHTRYGFVGAIGRLPRAMKIEVESEARAREILAEVGNDGEAYTSVASLPAAHRRFVDLGRALMTQPRLLLLDEITAGMTSAEKEQVIRLVRTRNERDGISVIVIEHDLDFVRALAPTCIVMVYGTVLASGNTSEVLARDDVYRAYVGEF